MQSYSKIIIISLLISLVVSTFFVVGMISFLQKNQALFSGGPVKEIIREKSRVVEKYVPQTTQEQMIVDIVKKSQDAVVSIIATKDLPVLEQYYVDPFQGFGFPGDNFGFQIPMQRQKGTQKQEVSSGSGFIASADGLIITNKHVVSEEEAEFTVLLNNGEKYPAKVLAKDPVQDIAIIKIEKKDLPMLQLGDSESIQTGQTVIAIGNALGEFRNTVSVGVVSGLRRSITAQGGGSLETLDDLIQTDAAINPGNSGGPLINLTGVVVGMNTAMTQTAQNIGFALPINKVKRDLEQVSKTGKITYPFLGVRYIMIDKDLQKKNNLSVDYGALVQRGQTDADLAVVPGSPADVAGIAENDIILEANGRKISVDNTLAKEIQNAKVGDVMTLKILSRGKEKTVKATLTERK